VLLVACSLGPEVPVEGAVLGGEHFSHAALLAGQRTYQRHCQSCHGPDGDGRGALGLHQNPPAADLRPGIIKYASVPAGSLPTDADLARSIRVGLKGTAMLGWPLAPEDSTAVIAYTKFFAPRWRTEGAGEPVQVTEDPWQDGAAALERGGALFHGEAGCVRCHPCIQPPVKAGDDPASLYRTIAAGVGGTKMPSWKGALAEADLWALVHFLRAGLGG
jgi:mono/diheme cytochrome c family protein